VSETELTYAVMKSFMQIMYSLCKQYVSWYEKEIKKVV